ncbi:MAG TPA: flagellar assembly protein FliW [Bacilli bacterium]
MFKDLHEKTIDLDGSIRGFGDKRFFSFNMVEEGNPFVMLQCVDDEQIGFLTADPFYFFADYCFDLSDGDKDKLGIESTDEVLVLNIVTIRNPFHASTINLLAPIVINSATRKGLQLVLPSNSHYDTAAPLFANNAMERKGFAAHADRG